MAEQKALPKGGMFLLESPAPADVFTPEDFSDEQKMIAQTTAEFIEKSIVPKIEQIEELDLDLITGLLRKAGELGLLGADVPEEFGGLGLDKITTTLITENMAGGFSFAISYGGHVGIGTLPIVFFGNAAQKQKYLPDLATGAQLAAYALTEPGSGSDAMAAKTTAVLSADGKHYILNGTKQWITNAGFADVFVVYAKVDGEKFSAFIVEKGFPGVSTGAEEKKMGLKGSSTRSLILEDAQVPVENLLGEIGKGHVIAFNILNIGRWKLGAGCAGSSKRALQLSAEYAQVRHQFGKPLAAFPLIQQKLANMAASSFALESLVYRTAGLIDAALAGVDAADGSQTAKAIAEYAVECSIAKIFGSECLDYCVDEGVQIHGGYGYMQEYPIERAYRDSRINRIFEGTNEINRLLIPGTLLKRTMKGELPLMPAMQRLQEELMSLMPPSFDDAPLAQEKHLIEMGRKMILMVAGLAVQKYMQKIEGEQEILAALADMTTELFAMESAVLRAEKALVAGGAAAAAPMLDLAVYFSHGAFSRMEAWAREALAAMEEGDMLRTQLTILRRLGRREPINSVALGRKIAARVLA